MGTTIVVVADVVTRYVRVELDNPCPADDSEPTASIAGFAFAFWIDTPAMRTATTTTNAMSIFFIVLV